MTFVELEQHLFGKLVMMEIQLTVMDAILFVMLKQAIYAQQLLHLYAPQTVEMVLESVVKFVTMATTSMEMAALQPAQ